jgi:hypothetical protein
MVKHFAIFMIVFLQDFFTVGLGWVLFGGLPFDLVSLSSLFAHPPLALESLFLNDDPIFFLMSA